MIKFSHTIFYVNDVLKTIRFFEVAFGIQPKFIHESHSYAELGTGETTLAFAAEELGRMNLPEGFQPNSLKSLPQACEIAFTTDNPEKIYEKAVKAGATGLSKPQKKPWGQMVGYVRDPSGILIEIAGELTS